MGPGVPCPPIRQIWCPGGLLNVALGLASPVPKITLELVAGTVKQEPRAPWTGPGAMLGRTKV